MGTREQVIRSSLLFKPGDRVSARLIEETERLLRQNRYLYDVEIKPAAERGGSVDIEVFTRDTWTLNLTGRFAHSGGASTSSFGIKEYNFLGTGTIAGFSRVSDPDRHGTLLELAHPRAFDGWTSIGYSQGRYSDGSRKAASIARPFYALDTRWAAGASWIDDHRVDPIYNAGEVRSKFRHREKDSEAWVGWSPGLIEGWAHRFSAGATRADDAYARAEGEIAPVPFPVDHDVRGPFVRYELVEDRFVRRRNHDQIARTEFVAMGLDFTLQLTRSAPSWGASRPAWLYSATLSDGFSLPWGHDLLATAIAERRVGASAEPFSHEGGTLRYYAPQGRYTAFYGFFSADRVRNASAPDLLLLGGDSGLRGYPQRYQAGEQRLVATLEQRVYTDWYLFRLVRIGGAAFIDAGRAWKGSNPNVVNGGWLADAGVGLRLAIDRAAFANVLHVDIAMPFDREPGIKSLQYLVKTHLTF